MTSPLPIASSQLLNLIQHHLVEAGLAESARTLLAETSVGSRGLLPHAHTNLIKCAKNGDWGSVLKALSGITLDDGDATKRNEKQQKEVDSILAQCHEMAILELGDLGEMDLAFATLKICRQTLDKVILTDSEEEHKLASDGSISQRCERKLHSLALRKSGENSSLPPGYYGPNNDISKEKRRGVIAQALAEIIPVLPASRLVSLCQQALKWQIHTGQMPMIRNVWLDSSDDTNNSNDKKSDKKRKKKRQQSMRRGRFDLVMGEVNIDDRDNLITKFSSKKSKSSHESVPLNPWHVIKFGKKSRVTSCSFFTDATQSSLVTGSSDGFIEIWNSDENYTKLRMDLEYQKRDDIMCHYGEQTTEDDGGPAPAILTTTVNSDSKLLASGDSAGTICIWDIKTGVLLCKLHKVHGGAITCLDFSQDGEESSRILSSSQDTTCREFGLRTRRLLKEFRGHSSFVNSCRYVLANSPSIHLLVVTASADSSIRIWCGKSAEVKLVLNPMHITNSNPSAVVSKSSTGDIQTNLGKNIHTVIPLHTPSNAMIVAAKTDKIFLVTYSGLALRTYEHESLQNDVESSESYDKGDFIAVSVSPSNKWLYGVKANGVCVCFDMISGDVKKTITDFGLETVGGKSDIELSGIVHHPFKGILAAYSSSAIQKRGLLTLWK
uniref:Uncharacterized protein n=1 Tax=Chaetoceros debilis TaxID=122233 RepID=A0A7S3PZB7_9STRA|mmetsp:Transcript_182/g.221  ORF Transcript_182/g.221 Transcript_182/m.221 type:complete len:665 (-) Transcript_182:2-1996(-)